MAQQKLLFQKGMTSDISPEVIPPDMGPYRLNVRVMSSDEGNDQSAETMKGNTLVSYTLPSGTNTTIGAYEYKKRSCVYYFIYNTSNNHSIVEYNYSANTVTKVFEDSILNFSASHLITGVNVVEKDDSNWLLYWTDNYNEPRKINVQKGKYYSAGNYTLGYKTPFNPYNIYRIKRPPVIPYYIWDNDSSQNINYLFKKLFKFRVQFVYDDYEESAFSMESNYILPETALGPNSTGEDYATQDNKIVVTVGTGSAIVTHIRILAKELNSTTYSLIAELDKAELGIANDTTYDYTFLNDGNYFPVNPLRDTQLYDFVPLKSQAQETIKGVKLVDGFVTEGYDNVDIDMRVPLTYEVATFNSNTFFPAMLYLKSGGVYKMGIIYYDEQGNRSGLTNITRWGTTVYQSGKFGTVLYIPFLTDPDYDAPHLTPNTDMQYVPIPNMEIYNAPPSWATRYQIAISKNEAMDRYLQFAVQQVRYTDFAGNAVAAGSATYVWITIKNIYDRYSYENPGSKLVYDFIPGDRVRFIANVSGAGPAYTDISTFFSFNDQEAYSFDAPSGVLKVKMTSTTPTNLLAGALFEVYQPAENVILDNEIMYESGNVYGITTDVHGNLVHDGTVKQLFVNASAVTNPSADTYVCTVATGHGLTVGRKVKLTGGAYSIYGAVSVASATSVTIDTTGYTIYGVFGAGTAVISASATFKYIGGDCFRRYQDMPFVTGPVNRLYSFVEAQNASNMWKSDAHDFGRPNRIDDQYKQTVGPSTMRWSANFIPETAINGLSTFYDVNFDTYQTAYGAIYKLWSTDQYLKIFQEFRVGNLPVEMVILNDNAGTQNVASTTKTLADIIQYYAWQGGINQHPESFASYGNVCWFMDVKNGTPCRLSNDGITPIGTTGKMHNYFVDKSKQIMSHTYKVNIFGVYDAKFSEYVMAFAQISQSFPAETLAWSEDENQWSSFYSYIPDFMCSYGVNIVSWKAGALYTHNTNSAYNTFYGVNYASRLWVYCNISPSSMKVYEAIALESDTQWDCTVETPSGQTTTMTSGNFVQKETFWYSPVLRDDNTPNIVASPPLLPNARWEGNPMRGQWALIKLSLTTTDFVVIFACDVRVIPSQRTNQ